MPFMREIINDAVCKKFEDKYGVLLFRPVRFEGDFEIRGRLEAATEAMHALAVLTMRAEYLYDYKRAFSQTISRVREEAISQLDEERQAKFEERLRREEEERALEPLPEERCEIVASNWEQKRAHQRKLNK